MATADAANNTMIVFLTNKIPHKFNSCAILDAIFLKPMDVPEIRLNRTPFKLNRGNLQTLKTIIITKIILESLKDSGSNFIKTYIKSI